MAYAGPSSNGRTLVFGTSYVGSNPAGPAIYLRTKPPSGGFLLLCRMRRIRTDEVKSRNRQKAYSVLPCRGDPPHCKKQKSRRFCNFFAIRDSFPVPSKRKWAVNSHFRRVFRLHSAIGKHTTIPNRKKVAVRTDFLFLAPWGSFVMAPRMSGSDLMDPDVAALINNGSRDGAARPLTKLQVPALAFCSYSDPALVR